MHGLTGNESSRERLFLGANTLECKSSRERKFRGTKVPGPFCFGEQKFQGARRPGSEWAKKRKFQVRADAASILLADSLRGANWPGSEKAVNRHCGTNAKVSRRQFGTDVDVVTSTMTL